MKRHQAIALGMLMALSLGAMAEVQSPKSDSAAYRESKILDSELALARNPNFYFTFNLRERRIELKSRGLVLRSWKARSINSWGKPVPFKPLTLVKKTALSLPQRKVIKPGEESAPPAKPAKPGEFELEALEVKDMPQKYTLELEEGILISVSLKNKGIAGVWSVIKWYIGLPLQTIKYHLKKQTMSIIQISFEDPKEGQALYWAFTEGLRGVIWFPELD